MWEKLRFVLVLLSFSSGLCWGEARALDISMAYSESNNKPIETLSELWKKADESLRIIEDSLIAQGEPVENLSKNLAELYQKSQELDQSVNELSLRFESLEAYLINLDRNIAQTNKKAKISSIEIAMWKSLAIAGIIGIVIGIFTKAYKI